MQARIARLESEKLALLGKTQKVTQELQAARKDGDELQEMIKKLMDTIERLIADSDSDLDEDEHL